MASVWPGFVIQRAPAGDTSHELPPQTQVHGPWGWSQWEARWQHLAEASARALNHPPSGRIGLVWNVSFLTTQGTTTGSPPADAQCFDTSGARKGTDGVFDTPIPPFLIRTTAKTDKIGGTRAI
jgi:hypothetical protein